jgi:hypothetical protein
MLIKVMLRNIKNCFAQKATGEFGFPPFYVTNHYLTVTSLIKYSYLAPNPRFAMLLLPVSPKKMSILQLQNR